MFYDVKTDIWYRSISLAVSKGREEKNLNAKKGKLYSKFIQNDKRTCEKLQENKNSARERGRILFVFKVTGDLIKDDTF